MQSRQLWRIFWATTLSVGALCSGLRMYYQHLNQARAVNQPNTDAYLAHVDYMVPIYPGTPTAIVMDKLKIATPRSDMSDAKFFAVGGVGYGGSTSEGEAGINVILRQHDARSILESLAYMPNSDAGRLYILLGLRRTRSNIFERQLSGLLFNRRHVFTMQGCLGTEHPVCEIAKEIANGKYDLEFMRFRP